MNYGELKAAIQNYCQTSDPLLTGQINDFIRTAEARVFRSVQLPAFWFERPLGDLLANDGEEVLANGAVEVDAVRISELSGVTAGPWRYLLRKDFDFLKEAYPGGVTADQGIPKFYAVKNADVKTAGPVGSRFQQITIRVAPIPTSSFFVYVAECYGFDGNAGFPRSIVGSAGDEGNTLNETWLSVSFPDVLLNGALCEAYSFSQGIPAVMAGPAIIQHHEQLFKEGLATMAATATGKDVQLSSAAG